MTCTMVNFGPSGDGGTRANRKLWFTELPPLLIPVLAFTPAASRATAFCWEPLRRLLTLVVGSTGSFQSQVKPAWSSLLGRTFRNSWMRRCQVAARNVALVYNWWSSFVRCAEPKRPREAITSRPLLLCGVGRLSESGNQLKIELTSLHEGAKSVERLLTGLSQFLSGLHNTAEQLTSKQCWERIWQRILEPLLAQERVPPALSG